MRQELINTFNFHYVNKSFICSANLSLSTNMAYMFVSFPTFVVYIIEFSHKFSLKFVLLSIVILSTTGGGYFGWSSRYLRRTPQYGWISYIGWLTWCTTYERLMSRRVKQYWCLRDMVSGDDYVYGKLWRNKKYNFFFICLQMAICILWHSRKIFITIKSCFGRFL